MTSTPAPPGAWRAGLYITPMSTALTRTELAYLVKDCDARVVLIEGERIGWAASGRNGGFVDASLTHGAENGKSRWPDEFEQLERLGLDNVREKDIFLVQPTSRPVNQSIMELLIMIDAFKRAGVAGVVPCVTSAIMAVCLFAESMATISQAERPARAGG